MAEIRQIGDVTYYNDGDWVEAAALVEHPDGRMEIIDWAEQAQEAMRQRSTGRAKQAAAA
jgi:hypothetical protein